MGRTETHFGELAQQDGLHPGRRLSSRTNRGHIHFAERRADDLLVEALRKIYLELGRDEGALAAKRTGSDPTPDFLLGKAEQIVEVDEIQLSPPTAS